MIFNRESLDKVIEWTSFTFTALSFRVLSHLEDCGKDRALLTANVTVTMLRRC